LILFSMHRSRRLIADFRRVRLTGRSADILLVNILASKLKTLNNDNYSETSDVQNLSDDQKKCISFPDINENIEIFEIYVFLVKQEEERDVLKIFSTEVFLTGIRCGGRK